MANRGTGLRVFVRLNNRMEKGEGSNALLTWATQTGEINMKYLRKLFGRKQSTTPEQRLFAAVDEINAAWAAMPDKKVRLWINWQDKEVIVQKYKHLNEQLYP